MSVKNYPYNDHTQLSPHFNVQEFRCKCGEKHDILIDNVLIDKLERLYSILDCSAIRITSGYRCSAHDKSVGGNGSGQHTLGKAADICCYDHSMTPISSKIVCCKAQDLGFGGIANINVAYIYTHVDVRAGKVWYGDETVSNNTVTTDFYNYFKEARAVIKGIDVSEYQKGVDWKKVKAAGIDFVIMRAGIATRKDSLFESHYAGACEAGLHVGAYWFSKAVNVAQAEQEAKQFLDTIRGKVFYYPIYMDLEYQNSLNTGKSNCSAMVRAFCNVLESENYWAGLYISRSHLGTYIEDDIKSRYSLWIADWTGSLKYNGQVGIWQSSETGRVDGISGKVDTDVSYVDYPEVIPAAGKNGFTVEIPKDEELPNPPYPGLPDDNPDTEDSIEASAWYKGHHYSGILYLDKE